MLKKITAALLILTILFALYIPVSAEPAYYTATPTASTVMVDGYPFAFDAYNIGGNNYFKLRDLAYVLNGTQEQFDIFWSAEENAILLITGMSYDILGSEMQQPNSRGTRAILSDSRMFLNYREINPTAYNIDGNNYFKLRDIGRIFDFAVEWDGERNTIAIDTTKGYTDENGVRSYADAYYGQPQGSAKHLDGNCMMINIYITNEKSVWTPDAMSANMLNIKYAKEYIESEGARYGRDINLICDYETIGDLTYMMSFEGNFHEVADFYGEEETADYKRTNTLLNEFIEKYIPYSELAEKYQTENITYAFYLNYHTDHDYALVYGADSAAVDRYHEKIAIFGMGIIAQGYPSALAHEFLHTYGAEDLYGVSEFDAVSRELVDYVMANYPNDIMLIVWDLETNAIVLNEVVNEIGAITAYNLGWLDEIDEFGQFPEIRRDIAAAFVYEPHRQGT